jgi:hypothetical protein
VVDYGRGVLAVAFWLAAIDPMGLAAMLQIPCAELNRNSASTL